MSTSLKVNANTKALRQALDRLSHLPGANDVTSNMVRLEANLGGLTLGRVSPTTAADITLDEPEILEEGECSVGFGNLTSLLARISSETVTLERHDNLLKLISKGGVDKLAADPDSVMHPKPFESAANGTVLMLGSKQFLAHTAICLPALPKGAERPELQGIIARKSGEHFCFIGTDTRMVHVSYLPKEICPEIDVTIPSPAVDCLRRLVGENNAPLTIVVYENCLSVTSPEFNFVSALLDKKAPNLDPLLLMPENQIAGGVEVGRLELLEAVRACSAVDPDRMFISVQMNEVVCTSENSQASVHRELPAVASTVMMIKLNPTYFAKTLESAGGAKVTIEPCGPKQNLVQIEESDRKIMLATLMR